MELKIGDFVTRESYNNDIVFRIKDIDDSKAVITGVSFRLIADSPINDLKKCNKTLDEILSEELYNNKNKIKVLKRKHE
ncbi:MAG: sporulation peptidase YabG [Bacilli bacterium]|nr:sporulation peptidase YabG [Bacilli bacterium]MDD4607984.1 sporulation peptidase YabG [Bacilli bacterium]